ncbi:DUF4374 domain-containing protein [Pedobacter arcticus]|uniref:DUF4374 domain-containing protein n=1 Tax=Pedobacter arcticus TaxID=752140 RepID=UPI0002DAEC83|nr:DUF4374 domain-containing protein [Pedobacter arcticus]
MKTTKSFLSLMVITALLFSCKKDKTEKSGDIPGSRYVIGYQTDTWNANYMLALDSIQQLMTGTIDMTGKGIEQGGSYIPVANTMFACDNEVEGAAPFYLNSASQLIAGNRVFIESTYAYGVTDDNKLLIIGASWEGSSTSNELMIYDPAQQIITSRKFNDFSTGNEYFDFPTGVTVSDGKVYVSGFNRNADWDMKQDKAFIRIYDYPSLNFISRIEDTRTTAIGMYYTNTGIIRTASGNVYTFSSNSLAAGYEMLEASKNSGILRINKGQTSFDANYFFDIQASSLKGKVLAAYPIGGEKAYIVYVPSEKDNLLWGFLFDSYEFKSAIVDLPTKTITPVTGLPLHGGDYYFGIGSLYAENGKAYKAFKTNTEVRIYGIDLKTGIATAGALITGGGTDISAITKLSPKN